MTLTPEVLHGLKCCISSAPRGNWQRTWCYENDLRALLAAYEQAVRERESDQAHIDALVRECRSLIDDTPMPNGSYLHTVTCNASRLQPVGNSACSCGIGRRIRALTAQVERLTIELAEHRKFDESFAGLSFAEIRDQRDAARKERDAARDALDEFGEHDHRCARAMQQQGRPTANGGYEVMYSGVWYEARPVDRTPECDCGLAAAMRALRQERDDLRAELAEEYKRQEEKA